jgi:superfamily I DNA/RNA helicase
MTQDKLSDEQRIAVKAQGNIVLTACPGSGKTRVIIHKLAYEVQTIPEHSKKKIVALTFTVRASEEIFRRLNALGINNNRIWSGTLHAFCLEWILKPYSSYLPELNNGYSIADEAFCNDLISILKEKNGLKQFDDVNLRFNRDGSFAELKVIQKKLLIEYHEILKSKKMIDFELILLYSYRLLKGFPKIAKTLSNIFKLICVDEYQDTQDLLYAIISSIINSGSNTSLFLVGDTDQAIYASLGGVAKSIDEIRLEINGKKIEALTLTGNYRSSQRIIDFYKHFQTQEIDIKALGANALEKGMITFNNTIKSPNVVNEIARLIQISLDKGISEDEICVLVPQWWLITSISRKLRALLPDVHFDASGLAPMSKNRENIWRHKLSCLFLTQPSPKIYSLRYRWATQFVELFQYLTGTQFKEEYLEPRNLLRLINSITSDETEGIDYLNDCFDQFFEALEIDYNKFSQLVEYRQLFFKNIEARLNDPEFKVPSDTASFKSFYREMTGVTINTCIGVKGEEYETVIAYGLLNGYIPHWNDIFSGNAVDASNKLMYVICSRAKTNLHLISEIGRTTKRGDALITTPELESKIFDYDDV